MKKLIEKTVKIRTGRRMTEETEICERAWPVEVYYGSDYSYCAADECTD